MSDREEQKSIGEIIAEARKSSKLSLRIVARRIPISFTYLSDIEKGKRMPSEKVLKGLAEQSELRLDFDYLMAFSNKIGEEAESYLREHPTFGKVIRKVAKKRLNESQLENLNDAIDKI